MPSTKWLTSGRGKPVRAAEGQHPLLQFRARDRRARRVLGETHGRGPLPPWARISGAAASGGPAGGRRALELRAVEELLERPCTERRGEVEDGPSGARRRDPRKRVGHVPRAERPGAVRAQALHHRTPGPGGARSRRCARHCSTGSPTARPRRRGAGPQPAGTRARPRAGAHVATEHGGRRRTREPVDPVQPARGRRGTRGRSRLDPVGAVPADAECASGTATASGGVG